MSHAKMSVGAPIGTMLNIGTAAPSGDVGLDLESLPDLGAMYPSQWLVTAVVTVGTADLFVWGLLALGTVGDEADDVWGLVNDKYGRMPAGKLGTLLPIGTHHLIVEGLGAFHSLFFQKAGAGSVDVSVRPIYFGGRGS